ncbi:MAG: TMEM43 family protein [Tepidisphaeraceae bacterium]
MADVYRETTSTGWFGRIGNSVIGALIGCVLILAVVVGLFWNEGRTLHRAQALDETENATVDGSPTSVDLAKENKPIYLTGDATAAGTLRDGKFDIAAPNALRLQRVVEMYQWKEKSHTETRRSLGGREEKETVYEYIKEWNGSLNDSSNFKHSGYDNPRTFKIQPWTINATDATLGAYKLNDVVLDRLAPIKAVTPVEASTKTTLPESPATLPTSRPGMLQHYTLSGEWMYLGSQSSPVVGDERVKFLSLPAGPISLVAKQVGGTFAEYAAKGGNVLLVETGSVSSHDLFQHDRSANAALGWLIRGAGFVVLVIGFSMVLKPLSTVADVVPLFGSIVGFGTFLVAIAVSIPVWLLTVAVAWLFYRPVWGVGLIVLAVGAVVAFRMLRKPASPPPLAGRMA